MSSKKQFDTELEEEGQYYSDVYDDVDVDEIPRYGGKVLSLMHRNNSNSDDSWLYDQSDPFNASLDEIVDMDDAIKSSIRPPTPPKSHSRVSISPRSFATKRSFLKSMGKGSRSPSPSKTSSKTSSLGSPKQKKSKFKHTSPRSRSRSPSPKSYYSRNTLKGFVRDIIQNEFENDLSVITPKMIKDKLTEDGIPFDKATIKDIIHDIVSEEKAASPKKKSKSRSKTSSKSPTSLYKSFIKQVSRLPSAKSKARKSRRAFRKAIKAKTPAHKLLKLAVQLQGPKISNSPILKKKRKSKK